MRNKWLIFLLFCCVSVSYGQESDSASVNLARFAYAVGNFGRLLPQEKVYLHFDNTSYYKGDKIWYQCYVVSPQENHPTQLSKTLYVELLNPGGDVISKRVLPVKNGRCHGEFTLDHLPFYSGFYEVRAYTKYMLNFGNDQIFSRIFPVFEEPHQKGDYKEKNLVKNYSYNYQQKRKKTKKEHKVNVKFYPEGGNLVDGVSSRVAFEATNAEGAPLAISGIVVDQDQNDIVGFASTHEGRGVFFYTPVEGRRDKAVVDFDGKQYDFDLPNPLDKGIVMNVDNLVSTDSLVIMIHKNKETPSCLLGLAFINGGRLYHYLAINVANERLIRFKLDKSIFPAGISRLVLFDEAGQIVADRMVFVSQPSLLQVQLEGGKEQYAPYEKVDFELSVRDTAGRPLNVPLSVSVRDGFAEVDDGGRSLLTDLLLMSEIKGYVYQPGYYFESQDYQHRQALDHLLMVQGWRRYDWKYWAGLQPFDLKYLPERGIEVHGQVVSFVRGKPRGDVEVSAYLTQRSRVDMDEDLFAEIVEEEETEMDKEKDSYMDLFKSDSTGHFSFVTDVKGKWNLILSVAKKGKRKDYRIVLDRLFSPDPVQYPLGNLLVRTSGDVKDEASSTNKASSNWTDYDFNQLIDVYEDSLRKKGIHEKVHRLDEVVVKAEKTTYEQEVNIARANSSSFYDVQAEIDEITDRGGYLAGDIIELLHNLDPYFIRYRKDDEIYVSYKGRHPLFVINYERTLDSYLEYTKYKNLSLESIKAIYVNEDHDFIYKYADPMLSRNQLDTMFKCVVFIETWPPSMISAKPGKGVRKTWLDGYSEVKEFYHRDYSKLPKGDDYRRTLYWNPELKPDSTGKAAVHFYNNSRCSRFTISAEALSDEGRIGILRE